MSMEAMGAILEAPAMSLTVGGTHSTPLPSTMDWSTKSAAASDGQR